MVEKKDGIIKICSAPIGLNVTIINDEQLLLNMRKLIDAIAGVKFYSL